MTSDSQKPLAGRIALVTGATRGIGGAVALGLAQAGAHMVKLEGGGWTADTVHFLTERGIPVCAHLGLTPQSVHALGGYRIQGRDQAGGNQSEHTDRCDARGGQHKDDEVDQRGRDSIHGVLLWGRG